MTNLTPIRFDASRAGDFSLMVNVGDRLSESGCTQVQVTGTGALTISHQGRDHEHKAQEPIHGELAGQVAELFATASQINWEGKFPGRPGIPDEAIVEWTLRDGANHEFRCKSWLRDVEKDAVMSRALKLLRAEVDRLSKGKLFL